MTRELNGKETRIKDADGDECVIYEADGKTFLGTQPRKKDGGFAVGLWDIQTRAVIRALDKHSGGKLRAMAERWKTDAQKDSRQASGHDNPEAVRAAAGAQEQCARELLKWLERGAT